MNGDWKVFLATDWNGLGLGLFKELLKSRLVGLQVETGDLIGSDVRLVSAACSISSFSQMTKLLFYNMCFNVSANRRASW